MNEELYNLGFYICRIEDTPKYLNGISNKLISLSECLCTHEPQICLCHGWKPNGDNAEYMKKLGLTPKQYFDYSNEIQNVFEDGRYFIDGRFSSEEDAKYFYCKYFHNRQYILISFATEYEYYAALTDNGSFRQSKQLVSTKEKSILGCDIIGFDIDSFHSFLCNSLQERFRNISFSEYGLIDSDYLTVKEMCKNIQGLGEPVDWMPVIVFEQLGLADLGAWYDEHLPEINRSYDKQQTWLDKDYRNAKIVRGYLDNHLSELKENEIFELYRTVDCLADQYENYPAILKRKNLWK